MKNKKYIIGFMSIGLLHASTLYVAAPGALARAKRDIGSQITNPLAGGNLAQARKNLDLITKENSVNGQRQTKQLNDRLQQLAQPLRKDPLKNQANIETAIPVLKASPTAADRILADQLQKTLDDAVAKKAAEEAEAKRVAYEQEAQRKAEEKRKADELQSKAQEEVAQKRDAQQREADRVTQQRADQIAGQKYEAADRERARIEADRARQAQQAAAAAGGRPVPAPAGETPAQRAARQAQEAQAAQRRAEQKYQDDLARALRDSEETERVAKQKREAADAERERNFNEYRQQEAKRVAAILDAERAKKQEDERKQRDAAEIKRQEDEEKAARVIYWNVFIRGTIAKTIREHEQFIQKQSAALVDLTDSGYVKAWKEALKSFAAATATFRNQLEALIRTINGDRFDEVTVTKNYNDYSKVFNDKIILFEQAKLAFDKAASEHPTKETAIENLEGAIATAQALKKEIEGRPASDNVAHHTVTLANGIKTAEEALQELRKASTPADIQNALKFAQGEIKNLNDKIKEIREQLLVVQKQHMLSELAKSGIVNTKNINVIGGVIKILTAHYPLTADYVKSMKAAAEKLLRETEDAQNEVERLLKVVQSDAFDNNVVSQAKSELRASNNKFIDAFIEQENLFKAAAKKNAQAIKKPLDEAVIVAQEQLAALEIHPLGKTLAHNKAELEEAIKNATIVSAGLDVLIADPFKATISIDSAEQTLIALKTATRKAQETLAKLVGGEVKGKETLIKELDYAIDSAEALLKQMAERSDAEQVILKNNKDALSEQIPFAKEFLVKLRKIDFAASDVEEASTELEALNKRIKNSRAALAKLGGGDETKGLEQERSNLIKKLTDLHIAETLTQTKEALAQAKKKLTINIDDLFDESHAEDSADHYYQNALELTTKIKAAKTTVVLAPLSKEVDELVADFNGMFEGLNNQIQRAVDEALKKSAPLSDGDSKRGGDAGTLVVKKPLPLTEKQAKTAVDDSLRQVQRIMVANPYNRLHDAASQGVFTILRDFVAAFEAMQRIPVASLPRAVPLLIEAHASATSVVPAYKAQLEKPLADLHAALDALRSAPASAESRALVRQLDTPALRDLGVYQAVIAATQGESLSESSSSASQALTAFGSGVTALSALTTGLTPAEQSTSLGKLLVNYELLMKNTALPFFQSLSLEEFGIVANFMQPQGATFALQQQEQNNALALLQPRLSPEKREAFNALMRAINKQQDDIAKASDPLQATPADIELLKKIKLEASTNSAFRAILASVLPQLRIVAPAAPESFFPPSEPSQQERKIAEAGNEISARAETTKEQAQDDMALLKRINEKLALMQREISTLERSEPGKDRADRLTHLEKERDDLAQQQLLLRSRLKREITKEYLEFSTLQLQAWQGLLDGTDKKDVISYVESNLKEHPLLFVSKEVENRFVSTFMSIANDARKGKAQSELWKTISTYQKNLWQAFEASNMSEVQKIYNAIATQDVNATQVRNFIVDDMQEKLELLGTAVSRSEA